jgi:hypothetical protein
MASYTVPAGHVGAHEKTLVADTADTVTFTGADLAEVRIITDGAADIYVSFGSSSTPAVAGSSSWRVPGVAGSTVLPVRTSGDTVVKLISSGTPEYSVSRT